MTDCREVTACRVCSGPLEPVLDLGVQCLAGVFPGPGEPDPPAFPLRLVRCAAGCGLLQLAHTVDARLMFGPSYGYRSSVTATMRRHLLGFAQEAWQLLQSYQSRPPFRRRRILDIGSNDNTLLRSLDGVTVEDRLNLVAIDPSDVPEAEGGLRVGTTLTRYAGFFPEDLPNGAPFDLIFTAACLYDSDAPVTWAQKVKEILQPTGLWAVEVADALALLMGAWDGICHEHILYFDVPAFAAVCQRSGLSVRQWSRNGCNGGSLRFYVGHADGGPVLPPGEYGGAEPLTHVDLHAFASRVYRSREELRSYLQDAYRKGETVHLLGSSTKSNVVLQSLGLREELPSLASDRDPRKHGRRTPGTGIPILSEEESRKEKPDVYLTCLYGFREEIIARERGFLDRGGKLVFALPMLEEVKG